MGLHDSFRQPGGARGGRIMLNGSVRVCRYRARFRVTRQDLRHRNGHLSPSEAVGKFNLRFRLNQPAKAHPFSRNASDTKAQQPRNRTTARQVVIAGQQPRQRIAHRHLPGTAPKTCSNVFRPRFAHHHRDLIPCRPPLAIRCALTG